ncbi:lipopolysaccharide biosynthesis protein [Rhodopirellula sp. JC639]|uniref:lipopolysaccharide biosynthesis protein n=1 Tax=Stieleria mannarensis TaxID=2755585 RepID=UPI001601C18D|nr:oligosaccharide flippase family protein [Rhodopirellula sp. JC639]
MSQASLSPSATKPAKTLTADTFSQSVLLIGGLMVVQRGIGFVRSFYVCGTLPAAEVGRWDLAFSFLMLVAPLAVLGIPGSFGRYVARFEKNGQQWRFLRQTLAACLALTLPVAALIWLFRDSVAEYFFGSAHDASLVSVLAIGLPVVVFFNFSTSWFSGKRLNRFVFRIQFAQTLFFALLCVVLFQMASVNATSVVTAYLLSCLVGTALAASYTLLDRRQTPPEETDPTDTGTTVGVQAFAGQPRRDAATGDRWSNVATFARRWIRGVFHALASVATSNWRRPAMQQRLLHRFFPPVTDQADPIWRKILPFAVWVWVSNALTNLFSVCDRLLLVNFIPDPSVDIQYLVGQYHTACIFPLLLMTIGAMAASTGLPYLSKDWESGDRDAVAERMNLMLKAIGLFCVAASVAILLVAPLLFGQIWKDKFSLGESLLPMTLCYCSLAAMTMVAQKYFWCLEKTWISSCCLLLGLVCNFLVGLALIGDFGINGVVASTLISHAIVLGGVLLISKLHRLRIDPGVFVVCIALFTLCLGKWIALLSLVLLLFAAWYTPLFVSDALRRSALEKLRSAFDVNPS